MSSDTNRRVEQARSWAITYEPDLAKGRREKQYALDLVEDATEQRRQWVQDARRAAQLIAEVTGTVTSDDVREAVPMPEDWDPRILGAVFRNGKHGPRFERVGYVQTRSARAHARPIAVWRLEERNE